LASLLGCAGYFALKGAAGLFHSVAPGTRFLVGPSLIFWGIFAAFLRVISSAVPIEWLCRSLLRDRYRRCERFCNERRRYAGRRADA
jgi:hypothetical protein